MHVDAGKQFKGKVTRITDYGAFVRLEDGRTGLVHISQVANVYVANVRDFLTVGQEVEPTLLDADEKGRLAFSLKTDPRLQKSSCLAQPAVFDQTPSPQSFEDMLSRYKTTSEDKIGNLRKTHAVQKRKNR